MPFSTTVAQLIKAVSLCDSRSLTSQKVALSLGHSEGSKWRKWRLRKRTLRPKLLEKLKPNESKWVAWTRNYSSIEAFSEHEAIRWTFDGKQKRHSDFSFLMFQSCKWMFEMFRIVSRRKGVEWKAKIHLSNPKDVICWWAVCVWCPLTGRLTELV